MKFLVKSFFASAVIAMLAACSSEELVSGGEGGTGQDNGEGAYIGLAIQMPGAGDTRSTTTETGGSSEGVEVGKDKENYVNDILVVLATTDNGYIAHGKCISKTAFPSLNSYKSVAKVTKTKLKAYYDDKANFSRNINVFVFCNPPAGLETKLAGCAAKSTDWVDYTTDAINLEASQIASKVDKGNFCMANYRIEERLLPASIEDWNMHKTENTAFNFSGFNNQGSDKEVDNATGKGAIKVERFAARFDFKDGSGKVDGNNNPTCTYDVVMNSDNKALIQVQLGKMTLVNLSNKCYNLRRVSNDGTGLASKKAATLCGAENGNNWVVGPNYLKFNEGLGKEFGKQTDTDGNESYNFAFDTYFNNPFFQNNGRMDYNAWGDTQVIADLLSKEEDKYNDNWNDKSYKIWHYAAENVIPANSSNQQNGLSTGVVFKGRMKGTNLLESGSEDLYKALNGEVITGNPSEDPILYSYDGALYFTWREVQKAAIKASVVMENNIPKKDDDGNVIVVTSRPIYGAVFGDGKIGEFEWGETKYTDGDNSERDPKSANSAWIAWQDARKASTNAVKDDDPNVKNALDAMRKAVTGAGFTIFQSSKDDQLGGPGYYCYYFYWNRHNDNGDPGAMGNMEFAVVRNNVYKLAVTKISRLGHPRIPENDPDKPKPDTPDESDDIYMTVTCQVLPWVVRVNNIEF